MVGLIIEQGNETVFIREREGKRIRENNPLPQKNG